MSNGHYERTLLILFLPCPDRGIGFVFDGFLCLFISFFVCLLNCFFVSKITGKRLDQFAWNFQGRRGVTMGRPDSILGLFGETARCSDANFFVNKCYELTARPICIKFSGKVCSDHGTT